MAALLALSVVALPRLGDFGEDRLGGRRSRDLPRSGFGAPLELDGTVLEPAFADDHAQRNPDQVGVLEFEAGALIAVVGQDFEPGGRERFFE